MIKLRELTTYLDNLLKIENIPDDSSNNGLQVEGSQKINKILFGVDACLELSKIAAREHADFIFVHHGLSWKDGFKRLTGHSAQIFSTLFKNDISLYAAHLPLDVHPKLGHNAQLAEILNLKNTVQFAEYANAEIGVMGELTSAMQVSQVAVILDKKLSTKSKIFGDQQKQISKIGIISGGPGSIGIEAAYKEKLDCLITGEVIHSSWHLINDLSICVIASGHYATETLGVKAVLENVEQKFDIECQFIDLPTGL